MIELYSRVWKNVLEICIFLEMIFLGCLISGSLEDLNQTYLFLLRVKGNIDSLSCKYSSWVHSPLCSLFPIWSIEWNFFLEVWTDFFLIVSVADNDWRMELTACLLAYLKDWYLTPEMIYSFSGTSKELILFLDWKTWKYL